MSTAPTHDARLTSDGLTACCDEDPRALDGGFSLELGTVTCSTVGPVVPPAVPAPLFVPFDQAEQVPADG